MYMGIRELKRVKDAIKHVTDHNLRHKTEDLRSKTLKYESKLTKILKQLHIELDKIFYYHLACLATFYAKMLLSLCRSI